MTFEDFCKENFWSNTAISTYLCVFIILITNSFLMTNSVNTGCFLTIIREEKPVNGYKFDLTTFCSQDLDFISIHYPLFRLERHTIEKLNFETNLLWSTEKCSLRLWRYAGGSGRGCPSDLLRPLYGLQVAVERMARAADALCMRNTSTNFLSVDVIFQYAFTLLFPNQLIIG